MNQKSCVVDAADGYTSASLVGFARNGQIVDELLDCIKSLTEGMKAMLNAVEILEKRVQVLENER